MMREIKIISSVDGSHQPALFYVPAKAKLNRRPVPVPLVVGLHPWSSDYTDKRARGYYTQCHKLGWTLIHPNFRGPNNRPEACASDLAVQDVLDAVEYARNHACIDVRRIYLLGLSGGGHMSLMMACRAPHLWAAISSWVPVSDLAVWYEYSQGCARWDYWQILDLELNLGKSCGGLPGPNTRRQYRKRSPLFHLHRAKGLAIDINAGIHDSEVPISHSLKAFNVLARANGYADKMLSDAQIALMTETAVIPPRLRNREQDEPGRTHKILFRRCAGPARITIFDGGHEIDIPAAFTWLAGMGKKQ